MTDPPSGDRPQIMLSEAGAPTTSWPATVVINTCAEYASTTVPVLLESLGVAGVPRQSIVIVCGQCADGQEPGIPMADDIRTIFVSYTAEALTGLIAVSESDAVTTPWVLYLQDTMVVGRDFAYRALMLCDSVSPETIDCVKLLDRYSLSVGLYSTAWLRTLDLAGFKRVVHTKADMQRIKLWSEDRVFGMCAADRSMYLAEFRNPEERVTMGDFRYGDVGAKRLIEHYPVLDVYKLKSWDGDVKRVGVVEVEGVGQMPNIPVGV